MRAHKFKIIDGGKMSATTSLVVTKPSLGASIENVVIKGDLSELSPIERVTYYKALADEMGISWVSKPFGYILLQAKLTLYALKNCTDQLRAKYKIDIAIKSQTVQDGILTVHVQARMPCGRHDEDIGVVNIAGLKGDALCNAQMKAVTKAKRRVTLSICGMSMVDESEIHTIKGAKVVDEHYVAPWRMSQEQRTRLQKSMTTNGWSKEDCRAFVAKFQGGQPNSENEYLEVLFAMSQNKPKTDIKSIIGSALEQDSCTKLAMQEIWQRAAEEARSFPAKYS